MMYKMLMACFMSLFLLGCGGLSNEEIAAQVKSSMQEEFSTSNDFRQYNLQITDLTVIKQTEHQYKGLGSLNFDGEEHKVTVNITVDKKNFMWEVPAEEFNFIRQKELADHVAQFQEEMAEIQQNHDREMAQIQQDLVDQMDQINSNQHAAF